jgi:L-iditol 2-dehydrogenase
MKPGKITLHEVETPRPSDGEMLVKIMAALTCGTDLKAFKRGHPVIPMPGVFGHEFSGVVADIGRGIRKFRVGDHIMAVHSAPCLACSYCRKRLYNLCENIMDTKVLGAFAEFIVLPSPLVKQNVFHKPGNVSFEEAAFLEPLSCVVHSIDPLNIQKGDRILIIGAGPIGLLHLLLLKEKGAIISITDTQKSRMSSAKKLGADFVFAADTLTSRFIKGSQKKHSFKSHLPDCAGYDYVFECTGMPEVWQQSVNYTRRGGTVILFGGCKSGTTVTYDTGKLHYDEITLKGVFHFTPSDVRKAYKLLCSKKVPVSKLISGKYPLKNIQNAFVKLSKGIGIKYAIIPSS